MLTLEHREFRPRLKVGADGFSTFRGAPFQASSSSALRRPRLCLRCGGHEEPEIVAAAHPARQSHGQNDAGVSVIAVFTLAFVTRGFFLDVFKGFVVNDAFFA